MDQKINILITGTPGTGKTRLGRILAVKLSLKYINIGDFARENECFIEYDSDLDCHIIDEKLMASKMKKVLDTCDKGIIIDHHDCEIFPKDMFKYIFCLTTSNEVLYDRLVERKYSDKKLKNNIESEIFQVILDDALNYFGPESVISLENNVETDLTNNIKTICNTVNQKVQT